MIESYRSDCRIRLRFKRYLLVPLTIFCIVEGLLYLSKQTLTINDILVASSSASRFKDKNDNDVLPVTTILQENDLHNSRNVSKSSVTTKKSQLQRLLIPIGLSSFDGDGSFDSIERLDSMVLNAKRRCDNAKNTETKQSKDLDLKEKTQMCALASTNMTEIQEYSKSYDIYTRKEKGMLVGSDINKEKKKIYEDFSQFVIAIGNPIDAKLQELQTSVIPFLKNDPSQIDLYYGRTSRKGLCYSSLDEILFGALMGRANSQGAILDTCESRTFRWCFVDERVYEDTLDKLLLWKGAATRFSVKPEYLPQEDANYTERNIHVDIIRTEHFVADWNSAIKEWTGSPMTVDVVSSVFTPEKNFKKFRQQSKKKRKVDRTQSVNQDVSKEGIQTLCYLLCTELVVYKKILLVSENLATSDILDTFQELDERCGFSIDTICGTSFHYHKNFYEGYDDKEY